RIPTEALPWPSQGEARTAGISSFGFGGTNAHLVVEEFPLTAEKVENPTLSFPHILTLSARSEDALKELVVSATHYLPERPGEELESICYAANTGRTHFEHRIAVVPGSLPQLVEQISALASDGITDRVFEGSAHTQGAPGLAFVFAGQGSQFAGMGRLLFDRS